MSMRDLRTDRYTFRLLLAFLTTLFDWVFLGALLFLTQASFWTVLVCLEKEINVYGSADL